MSRLLIGSSLSLVLLLTNVVGCSNQPAMEESVAKRSAAQSEEAKGDENSDEELTIGMKAPKLKIAQWVKGKQVDAFQPGKNYVVEFWATWCGPCLAGMPHISKLQELYQGEVTFIGVTREDEQTVSNFLEKPVDEDSDETWNDVIGYTLALDEDDATNTAYMRAAKQNGIPCAFIVGPDQHIEWIGHPGGIDAPLEQVVAGTWDREEYLAQWKKEQAAAAAMQAAMQKLQQAQADEDWDQALSVIDDLIKEQPDQIGVHMLKFSTLQRAERGDDALDVAEKIAKDNWDSTQALNYLAWRLVDGEARAEKSLEVALQFANRANELSNSEDASILDTLAKIHYEQGNLDEAITWQKKAVEQATDNDDIGATLKTYLEERDGDEDSPAASEAEQEEAAAEDETTDNEVESSDDAPDAEAADAKPEQESSEKSKTE